MSRRSARLSSRVANDVAPVAHAPIPPPAPVPTQDVNAKYATPVLSSFPPAATPTVVPQEPSKSPAAGIEVRTKFPVARIKRIMQADEDVGKVAQVTPIAVCTYPENLSFLLPALIIDPGADQFISLVQLKLWRCS